MYKNYFKIHIGDKELFKDILPNTSWQETDILGKLMADYIPLRLHEMIPVSEYYECRWDSIDSYNEVINTIEYSQIINKLLEYSANVEWFEFLPS